MATYTSNTGNQWTLIVDVTNVQVDIPNNRSKVSWSVKLKDVNRAIQALCTYHLSINGTNVWVSASGGTTITDLTMNNTVTLASGTTGWIGHNSDGSKSVAISAGIRTTNNQTAAWHIPQLSLSGTLALTTIPRASSFTLGGTTQTNASISVTISRASTNFTHRVRWRVGSGSWIDVASAATTSASFTVQPGNMPNLKSATITVGVQTYNGTTAIGSEATATRTITIPNTTISISGTTNTGSAQTVSITNSGGSLSYTRSWKLGSATGGNVASWTPPHSALPSATSGTLTCTVTTKNGTATINTVSATRTITVPSTVLPTFTAITHSEYVTNVSTKVGAYVQGKSRLTLGVTSPVAGSGSSIKSYSISVAGHKVGNGGTTPVITQSGTLTISATVTDNRNRTATKTTTISVLPYENPSITGVSFTRSNSDGTPNTTGTHLTIKATIRVRQLVVGGVEKNKIWYQSQSAQMGGSYTTKTNLEEQAGTVNGNYREVAYTHTHSGYPVDYPYNVRVRGGDIFSWSGYVAGGVPTGVVLQHWGESTTAFGKMIDSLDYNVLVGSKGMKVDGPAEFGGNTSIGNAGSARKKYSWGGLYSNSSTNTGVIRIHVGTTNTMFNAKISLWSYNYLADISVGGYTYTANTNWYQPKATGQVVGGTLNIRFSVSGTNRYIQIGDTNTNWGGYLHVTIDDVSVGYTPDFPSPFTVSLATSYIGTTSSTQPVGGLSLDTTYPIGAIYISTVNTNPSTFMGGTWVAFGTGRTLVGVDTSQTEFNKVEKVGGHKQLQSHTHTATTASGGAHTHTASTASAGAHTHKGWNNYNFVYDNLGAAAGSGRWGGGQAGGSTASAGAHTHTVTVNSGGAHTHTTTIASTGGGNAQNLQPYITVYMWKRTA